MKEVETPIQEAAKWLISISSLTSLTSIVVLTVIIIYQKKYFKFEVVMIMALLLGDLLQSVTILTPVFQYWNDDYPDNYQQSITCQLSGALRQLGILIEFTWAFNIAFTAFQGKKLTNYYQDRARKIFICLIGILYPLLFTLIQYFTGKIGQTDVGLNQSICFIDISVTLFLTFVLPLIVVVITNLFLFYKIYIHINRQIGKQRALVKQNRRQIILYPMILIFTQIWFLILLIAQLIEKKYLDWFVYRIFCYCISNLAGLFDVIVYGLIVILQDGLISQSQTTFGKSITTSNELQQNNENNENRQNQRGSINIRRPDQIQDIQPDQGFRTKSLENNEPLIKKKSYVID